jgi:GTPase SAR1 family protein
MESLVAKPDMTYKILIVGNPCVGKSCFLMRLCTNTFSKKYASTIGKNELYTGIGYCLI